MLQLHQLQPYTNAEKVLLNQCAIGETAEFDTTRPNKKSLDNEIRADFLRCLVINRYNKIKIDPKGIRFVGAWISGKLDLNGITTPYPFHFKKSVFENEIELFDADIKTLDLEGCLLIEGLKGDRVHVRSSVMLRRGFETRKKVSLVAAEIDGSLVCKQGIFKKADEQSSSLICNRAIVRGSIYLNEEFTSLGRISFNGTKVENDIKCQGGIFKNSNGCALSLHSMYVEGSLYFDENSVIEGDVNLSGSYIDSLVEFNDDANIPNDNNNRTVWDQKTIQNLYLDGLKYNHIYGPTDAKFRINWLNKIPNDYVQTQPWKQLAKVLRDMGHDEDADYLMIAFQEKKLESKKKKIKGINKDFECKNNIILCCFKHLFLYSSSYLYYKFSYIFMLLYKITSKYGYRPMRTVFIMVVMWFSFGFIYWYAATVAVFAPSSPLIFFDNNRTCKVESEGTQWLASPNDYNASNNWYYAAPGEYTTFQPFWYSLDVILPVVDLQMEKDWGVYIPSPSGDVTDILPFTTLNHTIRSLVWFENLLGWILSLILVAILSGLAKNEKE